MGQPEREGPLGRPKHRLEYHNKMGFKVIGSEGITMSDLAGDWDSRLF